ncbi:MAG: hypothetical protein ACREEM_08660 [Blastocatellia bacterium]
MKWLQRLFGKGQEETQAKRDGPGGVVPAVAIVCNAFITFDGAESLNGFAGQILQAQWPGIALQRDAQIEIASGFTGDEAAAKAKLTGLLEQAMRAAGVQQRQFNLEFFRAQSPAMTVWCMAAVRPGQAQTASGEETYFTGLIQGHLLRLKTAAPELALFVDEYFGNEQLQGIAQVAVEKMKLTLADGKQHSNVFWQKAVIYHVSTLPVEMGQAQGWFVRQFGGYTKLLEQGWQSAPAQTPDCSVWCHIIYGRTGKGAWVHMAICSIKESAPISATIMPIEFLTPEERRLLKL